MADAPRILYCHCAYAQVVPKDVKEGVLQGLCAGNAGFDAVADLCEMSARRDPHLQKLAASGPLKIAACYPRAVKWLFAAAQAPLHADSVEVLNMRTQTAADVLAALARPSVEPNLPSGKDTPDAPKPDELASPATAPS